MHILITDSGVGGLSVCAYAEQFVRVHGFGEPVRLTFANAAPANEYGYNSMPSTEVKLATFDRFLRTVTDRYAPDRIYVACNTLSVLLPDTPYAQTATIPVTGIVETAVELVLDRLADDPRSMTMIFATQTTIDTGTYPRLLGRRGVEPSRVISQACPGLADTISEDHGGARTTAEIRRWVDTAIAKLPRTEASVVACLACTHYGYRQQLFADAFAAAGVQAEVINPNEQALDDVFGTPAGLPTSRDVTVELVTAYAIPDTTVQTLTSFLSGISPATVDAMRAFKHVADLV
jgi:glutamate racemase